MANLTDDLGAPLEALHSCRETGSGATWARVMMEELQQLARAVLCLSYINAPAGRIMQIAPQQKCTAEQEIDPWESQSLSRNTSLIAMSHTTWCRIHGRRQLREVLQQVGCQPIA
jgi:hypothetical protein